MRRAERFGKPGGLLAEKEPAVVAKDGFAIGLRRLCGGKPAVERGFGMLLEKILQVLVNADLHQMPVVQSGTLDGAVRNVEAEGLDKMQA